MNHPKPSRGSRIEGQNDVRQDHTFRYHHPSFSKPLSVLGHVDKSNRHKRFYRQPSSIHYGPFGLEKYPAVVHNTGKLMRGPAPKTGRPRIEDRANTNEARKPWLKLNMSRRTWYRRQAEKRAGRE